MHNRKTPEPPSSSPPLKIPHRLNGLLACVYSQYTELVIIYMFISVYPFIKPQKKMRFIRIRDVDASPIAL
jgi:hypothetical protein